MPKALPSVWKKPGESPDAVAADAAERAGRAFGLVEKGLSGYAVKT
ncbi:hypothetical protein [Streptomyces sp. NPDC003710]